jgi:flagellar hook assembly protein FlgD
MSVLENKVSNLTIFNEELMRENENLRKNYTLNENENVVKKINFENEKNENGNENNGNNGNNGIDLKYRDLEYRLTVVTANLARAQQVGNDQLLARYDICIYICMYILRSSE